MKRLFRSTGLILFLFLLTSCSSNVSTNTSTTKSKEKPKNEGVLSRVEHSSDFSYSWNEVDSKVTKVVMVELSDEERDSNDYLYNYVIQVYFTIVNNSEDDYDTYPSQAVLAIEGHQLDPIGSSDIGGEIMSGVTKEGYVTYEVETLPDLESISGIRLKWPVTKQDSYEAGFRHEIDAIIDFK